MIGRKTAKKDNPQLTVREWHGRNPIRIVLDRKLKLSLDLKLFDKSAEIVNFNSIKSEQKHNLNYIKIDFNDDVLNSVLSKLYELEIQSLVIEGGEKLLTSFINANLWDEARIFVGNKYFKEGVKAPHFPFKPIEGIQLGDTLLYYYKNS